MHDPTAIFRFQEHDVYLPMVVLEELDSNKKGLSEASRNVRQTSRFLDDLMRDATKDTDRRRPSPAFGHEWPRATDTAGGKAEPERPAASSSRRASSPPRCPTIYPAMAPTTPSSRRRWRCRRCITKRASRWFPRTSTCASRPPWSVCMPRTTTATRPSKTPTSSTRGSRRCRRISGRRPARTSSPGKKAAARSTR